MISHQELNPHNFPTNTAVTENLNILLKRINLIRTAYGIPMVVTSGLRDQKQQQELIAAGKSNAPKSHHLTGEAVDIYDPDGKLYAFCKDNEKLLESAELWCEERMGAWVHFQIVPPASGHRWFKP